MGNSYMGKTKDWRGKKTRNIFYTQIPENCFQILVYFNKIKIR